jgi:hypothetical protein
MLLTYLFRGLISSLAIFGVFNRVKILSLRESFIEVVVGTLIYGFFGGSGYAYFLTATVLVTIIVKTPIFKKATE